MKEQIHKADYFEFIVGLLFSDDEQVRVDAIRKMASPQFDWNLFAKIAEENRVLIRCKSKLIETLAEVDHKTSMLFFPIEHFIKETDRESMDRDFSLMDSLEKQFRERGINYVIMKTLDQYPDLGHDLDFLVSQNHFEKAKKIIVEEFGGQPLSVTFCDRLVGKVSYAIPGHERSVELYPRISQLGEQYFSTDDIIRNKQEKIIGGTSHYTTSPEDQIMIACVHRLYRHWMIGVRISDIYNVWRLMSHERIDMQYISCKAREGGVFKALSFFLNLVKDVGRGGCMPRMRFPYTPPFSTTIRLFIDKIASDICKGRLRILLAPALIPLGFFALRIFKKNFIW